MHEPWPTRPSWLVRGGFPSDRPIQTSCKFPVKLGKINLRSFQQKKNCQTTSTKNMCSIFQPFIAKIYTLEILNIEIFNALSCKIKKLIRNKTIFCLFNFFQKVETSLIFLFEPYYRNKLYSNACFFLQWSTYQSSRQARF